MVADFLAHGGTIKKMPEARPHTVADVLQYLVEQDVQVEVVNRGESRRVYVYRGKPASLERLVLIANRHRRRRNLPPFDLGISPVSD
jgi:hypothetical protein